MKGINFLRAAALMGACIVSTGGRSQDLPVFDEPIRAFIAENDVPGISLAVSRNGQMVYVKGYGFADREAHQPIEAGSLFRIASLSKPITSIAIMKLVQEGELKLDAKVFGPDGLLGLRYGKQPYKQYVTDITVRLLLQHLGGGWGNSGDDPMFMDPAWSQDQLISNTLNSLPLKHAPGTNYEYSNFGYCVLGRVIEKITAGSYEEYVKDAILRPAGIYDMEVGGNTLAERRAHEVKYYGHDGEDPYIYNISRMDAHGGWIASASDLVQLLVHADGSAGGNAMLTEASIRTMTTAPAASPRYACGWGVDGKGNWYHAGSLPGTRTELRHGANGYCYALLINTRKDDTAFNKGLGRLMERIIHTEAPGTAARAPGTAVKKMIGDAFPVIDSLYHQYAIKNHIPGLAYGIVADGRLVHTGAIGAGDVAKKTPLSANSVFRIASMTKSFTAMAILALRDAGRLDLDDPVSKYIPEMKNIRPLTDDSPPITIRHLLSHSAGFPEDNPWGDRQLQKTDEDLINFIKGGVALSNTPGIGYEYSNLGFALLGHIVSKASGEPFESYIRRTIFEPLGMHSTYWEYTDVPAAELVHGYSWINGGWKEEEMLHSGAYGAMGGLLTSVEDFSRYIAFHLSAWPPRSGEDKGPVKRSSVREMHLPGKISGFAPLAKNAAGVLCPRVSTYNFGLSWSKDCTGKEQIGHSGGLPGFGTHWTFLPEYGIGIVSFCSLTYAASVALNFQVIDTLVAIAGLKPRQLPASDILRRRQQQLVALLPGWKNAVGNPIFSGNFFDDHSIDSLRKEAKGLFDKAGKIIRVEEMAPDNQLRGNFRMVGERADLMVRFTLSPENPALIQAYFIREVPKL